MTETSTSHRPWEAGRSNASMMHSQNQQTLPSISTLTAGMGQPPTEKGSLSLSMSGIQRDSGTWSGPSSTNPGSATYSSSATPFSNTSPNRYSGIPYSSDLSAGPASAGPQPSPGFAPTSQPQQLPSLNQNFEPSNSRGSGDFQHEDSRRSSMDSRVHHDLGKLAINTNSPCASTNASQSSLVSGLQGKRGIQANGYRGPRYSAVGPLSPLGPRSRPGFNPGRVAPPIAENPTSAVYLAEAPTAGQAYAFPDPEARPGRPPSNYVRRDSHPDSIVSSIFSNDSRLPPGQHELPDTNIHHHSLQHRQVKDVIDDEGSPNSTTPYSRTPELRVTHKLAERKRRSEMKGCFENLRARLPASQTNKSSKWETLSRAIDYITQLESQNNKYRAELDRLSSQHSDMELRMKSLEQQLQRANSASAHDIYASPPNTISPMFSGGGHNEVPRTLPPLVNGAMQGVQYDERR